MLDDFTVGGLVRHLQAHDQDKPIQFDGGFLTYLRVKDRGDSVVVEFNEQVEQDADGNIWVIPSPAT